MIELLIRDVRYAARSLTAAPAFSLIIVATLALGLGANAAVFSVLNAVVLRPLPYPDSERLLRLYGSSSGQDGYFPTPSLRQLRDESRTLEVAAAYTYRPEGVDLTGRERADRVRMLAVSAGYFELLRINPSFGRLFNRTEERSTARVAIVSERIWREYLGASPDAIGRTLIMNGFGYEVIAVMPARFRDPLEPLADIWLPVNLPETATSASDWQNNHLTGIARLREGATLDQARAELRAIGVQQAVHFRDRQPRSIEAVALQEALTGRSATMLWVLLGSVILLLLIACVNVASLVLARGAGREGELAVRTALGSSRAALVRQLLVENILLSLTGGVVGLAVAYGAGRALIAAAPVVSIFGSATGFDLRVFTFGLAAAVVAGMVFGLAPALEFTRPSLERVLRDNSRGGGSPRHVRMRRALVIAQVALALVLLIAAGLMVRTMQRLRGVDYGLDATHVMTFEVHLPNGRYAEAERRSQFHTAVLHRLEQLPGVRAAGAVSRLPGTGIYHSWGTVRPDRPAEGQARYGPDQRVVEGRYFETLRIPLLRGRTFGAEDTAAAPLKVVISAAVAQRVFPGEDPLGQPIRSGGSTGIVIGVVGDVAQTARGERTGIVYRSHTQFAANRNWPLAVVVALDQPSPTFVADARRILGELDPLLVLYQPRPLVEIIGDGVAQERFAMVLIAVFALLAVTLAAIGVYGVLAYTIARRRREIGIRLALGAPLAVVRRDVVIDGMRVTALGVILGLIVAAVATRWLSSLIYEVSVRDPIVFGSAAMVLTVIAFGAALHPARAATKVDPLAALRSE